MCKTNFKEKKNCFNNMASTREKLSPGVCEQLRHGPEAHPHRLISAFIFALWIVSCLTLSIFELVSVTEETDYSIAFKIARNPEAILDFESIILYLLIVFYLTFMKYILLLVH